MTYPLPEDLKIFRDLLEFGDGRAPLLPGAAGRGMKTNVDVVMDQGFFRFCHRAFDRLELLGEFQAGPLVLDHSDQGMQMSGRALQAIENLAMTSMHWALCHPVPQTILWGRIDINSRAAPLPISIPPR